MGEATTIASLPVGAGTEGAFEEFFERHRQRSVESIPTVR
jgi:hypothetical protein